MNDTHVSPYSDLGKSIFLKLCIYQTFKRVYYLTGDGLRCLLCRHSWRSSRPPINEECYSGKTRNTIGCEGGRVCGEIGHLMTHASMGNKLL